MRIVFVWLWMLALFPCAAVSQDVPADTYLDEEARELVRHARARRLIVDRRIQAYETTARERMSVGLRAGLAQKLLFRRETVSQIEWSRDTVRIEVLAAREVVPALVAQQHVPAGLSGWMPVLAFDPVDSEMLLRLDSTVFRHPLGAASEQDYQFASGDSTVIRLPDGRSVRLRELRIIPRRSDASLITGSFWLDDATHAVVQAYFRPAAPLGNTQRGGGSPFFLDVDSGSVNLEGELEIEYFAIDYGLWDLQWWLPRTVAMRGVGRFTGLTLPIEYERAYSDYNVEGDTSLVVTAADSTGTPEQRPCRPRGTFTVQAELFEVPDSVRERRTREALARRDSARAARPDSARVVCDRAFIVTQRANRELLQSDLLPHDIYGGETLLDPEELRGIARRVASIPPNPPGLAGRVWWGVGAAGLTRYNRVEGLSTGVRGEWTFARYTAEAEMRIGSADRDARGHVSLWRTGARADAGLGVYRRLDVLDIASRPLTTSTLVRSLVLGDDDNDYFEATGVELRLRPLPTHAQWYDVRVFAEAQRAVQTNTHFSILRLLDGDHGFRDNIAAASADQIGASVRLQGDYGMNPVGTRLTAILELHAETGDFQFVRPSATVRATAGLGRFAFGIEGAAGSSLGSAPAQRHWQLGGSSTIRGYSAVAVRGESYWRGRAELGFGAPFARITLFGDAGWAGPRSGFTASHPLRAVGVGVGVLDGLMRVDVARALDEPKRWKLHLSLGGIF